MLFYSRTISLQTSDIRHLTGPCISYALSTHITSVSISLCFFVFVFFSFFLERGFKHGIISSMISTPECWGRAMTTDDRTDDNLAAEIPAVGMPWNETPLDCTVQSCVLGCPCPHHSLNAQHKMHLSSKFFSLACCLSEPNYNVLKNH